MNSIPLDPDAVEAIQVDAVAIENAVAAIVPGADIDADLRLAVSCMDLTTLQGDDTEDRVRALCTRARSPLANDPVLTTAAVCVYHAMVPTALEALNGTDIPVAAVSAGFPHGLSPLSTRIAEIEASVAAGAQEIDIVIRRGHALKGNWQALYDEVAAFRTACGSAHMKAILATGELGDATTIARASYVCMAAGADFIKTSTGQEKVNATLPAGAVMMRAIRSFHAQTGRHVGFKPAGGIATADQALQWIALVRQELGNVWLKPELFRFGASRLLDDIAGRLA
ncbi:deoxyribose-phosphate aldolase [Sphingomonas cavernae]|uniref:Deoxyribose-phosphate aldolase n=1 Tax=Sphingomonas cavernae TaxID=2320861 RepID=A0A418W6C1_9SPHN|nr:deoxyribose-phosphate aldolase [Sphingomonas cavernae]RJF85580.1 deoxyribose-phosphate aldolase [Sphingomonas cavernae]